MTKVIFTIICLTLTIPAYAKSSIFKCTKDNKIVFSQQSCPDEFRQHRVEYQLGITTEIDSDKKIKTQDPLQALLSNETISKERLLQLLDSEVYRLRQENSYYEILRASKLQKLERNRYWQKKQVTDPEYTTELNEMNQHFDQLVSVNSGAISLLLDRKQLIEKESATAH